MHRRSTMQSTGRAKSKGMCICPRCGHIIRGSRTHKIKRKTNIVKKNEKEN